MASLPKRICGCGRVVAPGAICQCQAQRKAEADKRRPTARQRGYDSKWDIERRAFLALPANGKCNRCPNPATVVDHIKPHRGDRKLFWDRRNWQPLCAHCHNSKKQSEEKKSDANR